MSHSYTFTLKTTLILLDNCATEKSKGSPQKHGKQANNGSEQYITFKIKLTYPTKNRRLDDRNHKYR